MTASRRASPGAAALRRGEPRQGDPEPGGGDDLRRPRQRDAARHLPDPVLFLRFGRKPLEQLRALHAEAPAHPSPDGARPRPAEALLTLTSQETHDDPTQAGLDHRPSHGVGVCAHETAGQHGGRVTDAGKFHVELVAKGETVDVFLSDEGQKPVPAAGFKGTASSSSAASRPACPWSRRTATA